MGCKAAPSTLSSASEDADRVLDEYAYFVAIVVVAVLLYGVVGTHERATQLDGQVFVLFILTIAACETAIGLAILICLYRSKKTTDISLFNQLKG